MEQQLVVIVSFGLTSWNLAGELLVWLLYVIGLFIKSVYERFFEISSNLFLDIREFNRNGAPPFLGSYGMFQKSCTLKVDGKVAIKNFIPIKWINSQKK